VRERRGRLRLRLGHGAVESNGVGVERHIRADRAEAAELTSAAQRSAAQAGPAWGTEFGFCILAGFSLLLLDYRAGHDRIGQDRTGRTDRPAQHITAPA
jgi:hypothetical protein